MPENNMLETFTPVLTTKNWNDEWKELQKARREVDDASHWDERSKTFGIADAPSDYVKAFLELAHIEPGETVFDMGCGTGALSLPLGQAGHKVVAADFSAGMLGVMEGELAKRGVTSVFPQQMSWEDDWPAHGVRPGMVDVCVASRSIATADMRDSLLRLNDVARRRVCITLATRSSPRTDERVLHAIGLHSVLGRDFLYAFNILASEGILPEVAYIVSKRIETFDTFDQAYASLERMVRDATGKFATTGTLTAALQRLDAWLQDNLIDNELVGQIGKKGQSEKPLRLKEPRSITWAFIAWDK